MTFGALHWACIRFLFERSSVSSCIEGKPAFPSCTCFPASPRSRATGIFENCIATVRKHSSALMEVRDSGSEAPRTSGTSPSRQNATEGMSLQSLTREKCVSDIVSKRPSFLSTGRRAVQGDWRTQHRTTIPVVGPNWPLACAATGALAAPVPRGAQVLEESRLKDPFRKQGTLDWGIH